MQTEPETLSRRRRPAWLLAIAVVLIAVSAVVWARHRPAPVTAALPVVQRNEVIRENGLLVLKGQHQPFNGRLFENHPGGSRKLEIEVRSGKLEGLSRGWYSGGQVESEETFKADHSEGERTRWHANGTKKSIATIRHGQLEGLYTEWHDNGRKAVVMMMKDGKADGVVEAWHPSGELKSRTTLEMGKVVSQKFFDDPAAAQAKAE